MIKHQGLLLGARLDPFLTSAGNWALIRFILCFFTPRANEIQRADQFAHVNCIPIVELDGSAKKSDSPKIAGVSHEPSSAVREMSNMERPLLTLSGRSFAKQHSAYSPTNGFQADF
jgi:hypothetical protein